MDSRGVRGQSLGVLTLNWRSCGVLRARYINAASQIISWYHPILYRGVNTSPELNMKAARYYGPGDVRVEDVPEPELKQGQVKLKVTRLLILIIRALLMSPSSLGMSDLPDCTTVTLNCSSSLSGVEVSLARHPSRHSL